jgi:hypothetical protein
MSCAPCSSLSRTISTRFEDEDALGSSRFEEEDEVALGRTGSCETEEALGRSCSCAIPEPIVTKKRPHSELLADNAIVENIANELVGGDDATLSTTDEEEDSIRRLDHLTRCLFPEPALEEGEICDDPQARFDTSKLIGPCKDMVVTNEEAMNNPSQLY